MRLSTIAVIFLFALPVFGQDKHFQVEQLGLELYDKEVFDASDQMDNALAKSEVRNGKYYLRNKQKGEYAYHSFDTYSLAPSSDFYVEMVFEKMEGSKRYGSGLLFNRANTIKANEYEFIISGDQHFKINRSIDDRYENLIEWTFFEPIHPKGNNTLGMWMKGEKCYFYINNELAYEMKRPNYLGSAMGYTVGPKTELAVQDFKIYYQAFPIKTIADTAKEYPKVSPGTAINTPGDEFYPVLSADGKMMTFARGEDVGIVSLDHRVLYYSEYDDASQSWRNAKPFPPSINQGHTPQIVYISPDKKELVINGTYDEKGKYVRDQGLSVSHRTSRGWSVPENIEIEGFENENLYETYSLSVTGRVMILSVQTREGFGESDLHVSFKQGNKWSKPQNMGAVVNSWGDDDSPCLAPDNVTLYYTSVGKNGYGKGDIFMTKRLDDTWLNWSEPLNLGPKINTKCGESGLQVDINGEYAYINHSFDEKSEFLDIAKFMLPPSARPEPVMLLKGRVLNKQTEEPVHAKVVYENIDSNHEVGLTRSSKEDGSFALVLPYGANYSVVPVVKGWLCESSIVKLKDSIKSRTSEKEMILYVTPMEVGKKVELHGIFYKPDAFELLPSSQTELFHLVELMKRNPKMQIEIAGHTDVGTETSTDEALNALSLKRAEEIKKFLISNGTKAERIKTKGYGRTLPLPGGKAQNRRVEITILQLD